MFNKLKQFNDLRQQANEIKKVLAEESVTAENKAVTLVMDGNQDVQEIKINTDYLSPDKKNELENLTREAINDAIKKAQRKMAMKMQSMGKLNLPGLK